MTTDRETLKASLSPVDFPAHKADLVEYAENNGVDQETVRALRALPSETYQNVTEVLRSAPLDKTSEEEQSDAGQAQQASRHPKSGLAQHERRSPANPIAEELGENRGS